MAKLKLFKVSDVKVEFSTPIQLKLGVRVGVESRIRVGV
jgi:hypothetical protein